MQLRLALLLPLLSSAFALPTSETNGTSSNTLEKRDRFPYVGSYNGDCKGNPIGPRPEMKNSNCIGFHKDAAAQKIGIYYGTGIYAFSSVAFYADDHCNVGIQTATQPAIVPPEEDDFTCWEIENETNRVGSVQIW